MRTHWRIDKLAPNKWSIMSNVFFSDGTCSGWGKLSHYPTRKAALTVAMIMRERGEPISWQGGAVRMGIAIVEPCKSKEDEGVLEHSAWYDTSAELR